MNANFNPDGNCNFNWNLKPENANDNLGVRSVVVSNNPGRCSFKRAPPFYLGQKVHGRKHFVHLIVDLKVVKYY
ncbi:hypothetical protein A3B45_00810 [Candidatus Daviesbacteria bacterium RIFCSPLOWO2_01_FULL_39_12]|uniref:Uncharacterized protein n=1 Tax=Candidatus Daviesbacteria bacterium RIFCSPLOWO2_01_FULL_39_12 TaxID=1797785 RepID=A0A1F5KQQ1_9BACT|nr:MAG: hypothetical protein A3B45_00810 [Candidatus Daviesbacteria bacterium RIFCSPLOWO2_01_FULL_39_12]